jgi:hypothetical protein
MEAKNVLRIVSNYVYSIAEKKEEGILLEP